MSKRQLTVLVTIFAIVFVVIISILSISRYPAKVVLGNKLFYLEVSDTEYLMKKGLSGHKPLEHNQGMLFVFRESAKHGIWMKDMLFPIDIIWLDENLRIVHIEKTVLPDSYPKIFTPKVEATFVLEVLAGQSEILGLKTGDTMQFLSKNF